MAHGTMIHHGTWDMVGSGIGIKKKIKRASKKIKTGSKRNKKRIKKTIFLDRPLPLLSWPCGLRVLW